MEIYKTFILSFLLACSSVIAAVAGEVPQNVFQIPEYPGTEPFHRYSVGEQSFQYPFATVLQIYKTKDGSPLDSEKVIKFFKNSLAEKGWTKGIYEPKYTETYLGLQTQVFENLDDGTHIQASGDFQVWVAPKDGMLTIFLRQWRISSPDQKTREQVAKIIEALKGSEAAQNYRNGKWKDQQDSGWQEYYANEYLVGRNTIPLADETVKYKSDIDTEGYIYISLLTYRDAAIAQQEMIRQKTNHFVGPHGAILTIGKTVVVIRSRTEQKAKVDGLIAQLEGLTN